VVTAGATKTLISQAGCGSGPDRNEGDKDPRGKRVSLRAKHALLGMWRQS